ncbi:hypothetical protein ACU686_45025 [Yinghuangia aomiensis]
MGRRGDRFVPFLVSVFFFLWTINLMSIVPLAAVPGDVADRLSGGDRRHRVGHLRRGRDPRAGRLGVSAEHHVPAGPCRHGCTCWSRRRSSCTCS